MKLDELNQVQDALETAKNGLTWYRDTFPSVDSQADDEALAQIDAALDVLAAERKRAEAEPTPAEPCREGAGSDGPF